MRSPKLDNHNSTIRLRYKSVVFLPTHWLLVRLHCLEVTLLWHEAWARLGKGRLGGTGSLVLSGAEETLKKTEKNKDKSSHGTLATCLHYKVKQADRQNGTDTIFIDRYRNTPKCKQYVHNICGIFFEFVMLLWDRGGIWQKSEKSKIYSFVVLFVICLVVKQNKQWYKFHFF